MGKCDNIIIKNLRANDFLNIFSFEIILDGKKGIY